MNTEILLAIADSHILDLRRDAAGRRAARGARQHAAAGGPGRDRRGPRDGRRIPVRSRVGFTLVEAGLRLVATGGPQHLRPELTARTDGQS